MGPTKMCARYMMLAVGGLTFFTAATAVAWQAAGAAVTLGTYAVR
jgi:hypothetical protein